MSDNSTNSCPACDSEHIDEGIPHALGLCIECGFVIKKDNSIEPISFTEQPRSPDLSQSIEGWTQEIRIRDSSEHNLLNILSRTHSLSESLLLSEDTQMHAAEFAKDAWKLDFFQGRSIHTGSAAAVYLACRDYQCPRPISVIADRADADISTLRNTYRALATILDLRIKPPVPEDFLDFIGKTLSLSSKEVALASNLIYDSRSSTVGNPAGIAGAAVYLVLQGQQNNRSVTYNEIAQIIGMTKETVWKRSNELQLA